MLDFWHWQIFVLAATSGPSLVSTLSCGYWNQFVFVEVSRAWSWPPLFSAKVKTITQLYLSSVWDEMSGSWYELAGLANCQASLWNSFIMVMLLCMQLLITRNGSAPYLSSHHYVGSLLYLTTIICHFPLLPHCTSGWTAEWATLIWQKKHTGSGKW